MIVTPTFKFGLTIAVVAVFAGPAAADTTFECSNTASGASWTVAVNDQKRTVDGAPAEVSAYRVNWRDPATGGLYDLDRKSGALTFVNPSSTGGYMLFHRCRVK